MKKLYILSIVLILGRSGGLLAQQKEYSGQMQITPVAVEQRGDSLYVRLNVDISGINVDSRKSISLIPTLSASDNSLALPEVMVKGRENYHVYQREMSLMSERQKKAYDETAPYAVLKGFNAGSGKKRVEYSKAIKYEPWMADAQLDIYEDLCGCGNPFRRMGVTMLVNQISLEKIILIEPYVITPYLSYIQPNVETVKRRELVGEAFLDFVVNQTDIRPDYMSNPRELRKITDLISEVKDDQNLTVRAINVIGYASPEGTLANNKRLSEGRAKALVEYLVPKFNYPKDMYKVVFGGENWDGLKEEVEKSDMPYKQEVLDIIATIPAEIDYRTNTSRKKSLMMLRQGEPYRYMLREFFPSLRKAICQIDFEVKNFDISQAKEIIKSRPQNLSLSEMFMVANTYPKGSQEFVDLFETAARIFPDDPTANLNAAAAALSRGDLVYAQRHLDRAKTISDSREYDNTKGVLAMLKGDYDLAESLLNKAASAGLIEARQNLEELARKRENIAEIEVQKSKRDN